MTSPSESKRPRVLVDVDDVVANFLQLFASALNATGVRKIPNGWQRTKWDLAEEFNLTKDEEKMVYDLLTLPGVAMHMHPMPGAIEGVKKVMEVADVYFVSAPLKESPTWVYDRQGWLIKHFGEEQGKKFAPVHDKFIIYGDYLVDDKPANCEEWQAAWPGSRALFWATTSTQDPTSKIHHVYDWDQVLTWLQLTWRS